MDDLLEIYYEDLSDELKAKIRKHLDVETDEEVLAETNWDTQPITSVIVEKAFMKRTP